MLAAARAETEIEIAGIRIWDRVGHADGERGPSVVCLSGLRPALSLPVLARPDRLPAVLWASAPASRCPPLGRVERLHRKLGGCEKRPFAPLPARRRGRSQAYHDALVARIHDEEPSCSRIWAAWSTTSSVASRFVKDGISGRLGAWTSGTATRSLTA